MQREDKLSLLRRLLEKLLENPKEVPDLLRQLIAEAEKEEAESTMGLSFRSKLAHEAIDPLGLSRRVNLALARDFMYNEKRWRRYSIFRLSECPDEFLLGAKGIRTKSLQEIREKSGNYSGN